MSPRNWRVQTTVEARATPSRECHQERLPSATSDLGSAIRQPGRAQTPALVHAARQLALIVEGQWKRSVQRQLLELFVSEPSIGCRFALLPAPASCFPRSSVLPTFSPAFQAAAAHTDDS